MSSYPVFNNKTASDVDLSTLVAGSQIGGVIDMMRLTSLSMHAVAAITSGSLVVKLQASDVTDKTKVSKQHSDDPNHWVDTAAVVTLDNTAPCFTFSVSSFPSRFARIVVDSVSSPVGTADVYVTCKNG